MLARLAEGDASMGDIRRAVACRKTFYVVRSVIERGLAASNQGSYFITSRGHHALQQLRMGLPVDCR